MQRLVECQPDHSSIPFSWQKNEFSFENQQDLELNDDQGDNTDSPTKCSKPNWGNTEKGLLGFALRFEDKWNADHSSVPFFLIKNELSSENQQNLQLDNQGGDNAPPYVCSKLGWTNTEKMGPLGFALGCECLAV